MWNENSKKRNSKELKTPEQAPSPDSIEWMTVGKIAEYIGKSYDWVQARIRNYETEAREWPDSQRRVRKYYPYSVTEQLMAEVHGISKHPVVNERDISLHGISVLLGRDEKWISARVPFLDIDTTTKLNPSNNRMFEYYDKETDLPALQAENTRMRLYPIATMHDSTVDGLANKIGVDRKWVLRRLRYIALIPTVKTNPGNHQLNSYYPTDETIEQLKGLSDHFDNLKPHHPSEVKAMRHHKGVDSENWMEFASCAQTDPEIFNTVSNTRTVRIAKEICNRCVSQTFCLDFAVANNEQDGIWGGKTPNERKQLKLIN